MEEQKNVRTIKLNVWQLVSIFLLISLIASIYFGATGKFVFLQNKGLVSNEIGNKVIEYINKYLVQPGTEASLKDVKFDSSLGLYEVITEYMGNEISVFVSPNGKYLILADKRAILDLEKPLEISSSMEEESQNEEISKSDKPRAELFIFSYCPYGVQALKPFANVAKLMKDYAEFYVKFFSHMHGEFEKQQNIIQECIIRMYPEKYWDYAIKFADEVFRKCYGNLTCDKEESVRIMEELKIDYNKVFECVEKYGETYYKQDIEDARKYGLSGSPSFVINGVYVRNVVRNEEGIKNAVCQAFNTKPEICNQVLSTQTQNVPQGSC
ncbi:MAG: hypothetical protein QXT34_01570 [Candidatus Aenigmatarchaeota archaeon]